MFLFFSFLILPKSISFFWNNRSSLRLVLRSQFFTGIFLTFHFTYSFSRLIFYARNVFFGFKLRFFHANRASFFLFFIFLHYFRRIYFLSFNKKRLWVSRCFLLLLSIGAAFLGYVLPYRQISYWRATVIVNLVSVIPYVRPKICILLWGAFTVNLYTLKRFFTLHFFLPFVVLVLVLCHVLLLHLTGSNSTIIRVSRKNFFKLFFIKDVITWTFFFGVLCFLRHIAINLLGDVENFLEANSLVTPLHIKPEWYFLFAYSILRCIPSKSFRIISLVLSVVFPLTLIFAKSKSANSNLRLFFACFFLLTVTRSIPVESPYVLFSQLLSISFFVFFLL